MTEEEERVWQEKVSALMTRLETAETALTALQTRQPEASPEIAALTATVTKLSEQLTAAEAKLAEIQSTPPSPKSADDSPIPVMTPVTLSAPTAQPDPPPKVEGRKAHNWV